MVNIINFYNQYLYFPFIRKIMRGYFRLKKDENLHIIHEIKHELSQLILFDSNKENSNLIFGSAYEISEIVVRQYLYRSLLGFTFSRILLFSLGKNSSFIYPLPKLWQQALIKKNIKVNKFLCSLLFILFVSYLIFKSFFTYFKLIINSIRFISNKKESEKFIYFFKLNNNNFPTNKEFKNYDIISWYLNWNHKNKEIKIIKHDYKEKENLNLSEYNILYNKYFYTSNFSLKFFLKFSYFFLKMIFILFIFIILRKWYFLIILEESVLSNYIRNKQKNEIACEYLFHSSDWYYRPLWTYEAEKFGSKIYLYFYATVHNQYENLHSDGWNMSTWSNYIIWNKYQKEYLERVIETKNFNSYVVGPIWFNDSSVTMPNLPNKFIAVFDNQPHRSSFYRILGHPEEYLVPKVINKFLDDILFVAEQQNIYFVHKPKRDFIRKYHHINYKNKLIKIEGNQLYQRINPGIAAIRLIKKSTCVISLPYTSTAIIAQSLGIPSAYYDPTGKIKKNTTAANGVTILRNKKELLIWVNTYKEQN